MCGGRIRETSMFKLPFIAVAFASACSFVFAEDADITILLETDEPVIGTLGSTPLKYVITRNMISDQGFTSLTDVLDSIPFLTFANDTLGNGTTGVIDLRGFGETAHSSTLVLVNGIPLNNPTNEAPNLSLIPLSMIEKIEVSVGGASAAAGNEAVGGVISISTVAGTTSGFTQILANGGQFGSIGGGISGAFEIGDQTGLAYGIENSDQSGYRDFSEFDRTTANFTFSHKTGDHTFSLSFMETEENRNGSGAISQETLNSSRTSAGTRSIADIEQRLIGLSFKSDQSDQHSYQIDLSSRNSDQFVLYDYSPTGTFGAEQQVDQSTTIDSLTLQSQFQVGEGNVVTGIDLDKSKYLNVNEFYPSSPTTTDQKRDEVSFFGEYTHHITENSRWNLGYRHSHIEDELTSTSVLDRYLNAIAAGFSTNLGSTDYFIKLDKGFRTPTFDENNATYTDQKLKPQTHLSLEAGALRTDYGVSGFAMRIKDEIRPTIKYYTAFGGYYSATNANFNETERLGAHVFYNTMLSDDVEIKATYSWIQAKAISGFNTGKLLPGVSEHTGSLKLDFIHNEQIKSALDWRYQSSSYALNDNQNLYGKHGERTVVDYALIYRNNNLNGGFRINNLFDTRYNLYHIVSATPSTAASNGPSVTPAEPINFQIYFEYMF